MPKFRIDLPDGRAVQVEAPDAQSAAEGGAAWAKSNPLTGRAAADRDATRRVKNTPDWIRAVNKGATFGFADEMDAAGAALETGVTNIFKRATGQKPEYGMKDAYGAVMDANERGDNKFAAEHPVANFGLQVVGGVATGGAGAARFVGGARSLPGAMLRSGTVGTVTGGVSGFGNASGGLRERGLGAAKGAAAGAVVGAAVPVAARGAQTAGRAITNAADSMTGGRASAFLGGNEARAVQRIQDALRADGLDEAAISRVTQEWIATGAPPPMLMNVAGENTRRLVRLAGMKGGDAAVELGGIARRERANMPDVARNRARQLTPGETRSAPQVLAAAQENLDNAAENAYRGPYREETLVTPEMAQALRGNPGRAALSRARQAAEARQNYEQMGELDRLRSGDVENFTDPIRAGTVDRVRIAMRNMGRGAARNPDTQDIAGGLRSRAAQIDTALDRIPEIQSARGTFRAHSRFIEGIEDVGPNIFRQSADEFAPQFEAIPATTPDPSRLGAQIGARQTITDAFGQGPRQARTMADKIADGADPQRNLRALFGEEADRFVEAIRRIRQRVDDANFVDPNVGAKTAPLQEDAAAANDVVQVLRNNGLGTLLTKLTRGLTLTEQEAAIVAQIARSAPGDAMRRLSAPRPVPAQVGSNVARQVGQSVARPAAAEYARERQ